MALVPIAILQRYEERGEGKEREGEREGRGERKGREEEPSEG